MTQLSDEILIAYVDGELGAKQQEAVDGVLKADPLSERRLQAFQDSRQQLIQVFQSMLMAEQRNMAVDRERSRQANGKTPAGSGRSRTNGYRSVWVPAISVAVLLLMMGILAGYFIGRSPSDDASGQFGAFWSEDALEREKQRMRDMVEKVPAPEPETTGATPSPRPDTGLKWFEHLARMHEKGADNFLKSFKGQSRNPDLVLFQLPKTAFTPDRLPILSDEEAKFIGADVIEDKQQRYIRTAYRDLNQGALPLGLYIGKGDKDSLTLERGYQGEQNYIRWTQKGRSYLMIGAVPHWRLIVLAVAVQRQLVR
jgi:anti-sigma factor RsiW